MTFPRIQLPPPGKRSLKLFKPRTVFPEKMSHVYVAHTYSPEHSAFHAGGGVQAIRFTGGRMYVDELPVLKPYFGTDGVSWSQQTPGHFTSGHLHFLSDGVELHGTVYRGTTPADAQQHDVLATTIQPVNYATQITTRRFPANLDPAEIPSDAWTTGLVLAIGYTQNLGDTVPTPQVLLDQQDISTSTAWSIDPKTQQTVLSLVLDAGVACTFDNSLYLTGKIEFNIYQVLPTFVGTLSSTCQDLSGNGVYFWKGTAQPTAATDAAATDATANEGAVTGGVASAAVAAPRALLHPEKFTPLALTENDLVPAADSSLSIAELMSIIPDSSVSEMANTILLENMKWAMGQDSTETDWLSMVFGEKPPVIPQSQQDLVKKSLSWYQGDFAKSYLGYAISNYSGPGAPSKNLNDDQKLQLKYFLQTGMAKDSDFNTQQNGIYLNAFIQAKPRLQAYIADTSGKWSQQLYAVVTSPAQMTLMINRIYGASGQQGAMTPANNFATLLSALQPSGQLARQYIQAVLSGVLSNTAHQTTMKADSQSDVMEWLPDFLQQFLDRVAHDDSVPDEAKIAAAQIKQMMQDEGMSITQLAQQMSNFIVNANGANILQKTQNAQSAFIKAYPKFEKVGQMMFFAGWCMGILMVTKAFQNWKNLTPEDKAKAILSTVTLGLEALDIVPKFIQGVKEMGMNGWNKFTEWRNSSEGSVEEIEMTESADWVKNGANETTPLFDAVNGGIKVEATLWERIFTGAAKIVAVVGVVVSAAFAVLSTIDFINDIRSGQPVTKDIFDGIMMATNILMTICLVIDLFVATTVFAMAAAVLAIVGLIIAFIAMFVVKPKNPLDSLMSDYIIPFVKGLPPQTPPPNPAGRSGPAPSPAFA
jgi:hypothetical protein